MQKKTKNILFHKVTICCSLPLQLPAMTLNNIEIRIRIRIRNIYFSSKHRGEKLQVLRHIIYTPCFDCSENCRLIAAGKGKKPTSGCLTPFALLSPTLCPNCLFQTWLEILIALAKIEKNFKTKPWFDLLDAVLCCPYS